MQFLQIVRNCVASAQKYRGEEFVIGFAALFFFASSVRSFTTKGMPLSSPSFCSLREPESLWNVKDPIVRENANGARVLSLAEQEMANLIPLCRPRASEDPDFVLIIPYKRFLPQRKNTKKDTHAQSDAEGENDT